IENKTSEKIIPIPPKLSAQTTVEEWMHYLSQNNIDSLPEFDDIFLFDLPGNETQTSYMAWAKKGAIVEEAHEEEDEYLFMLKGRCSVTINGVINYYKEGDLIFIPK